MLAAQPLLMYTIATDTAVRPTFPVIHMCSLLSSRTRAHSPSALHSIPTPPPPRCPAFLLSPSHATPSSRGGCSSSRRWVSTTPNMSKPFFWNSRYSSPQYGTREIVLVLSPIRLPLLRAPTPTVHTMRSGRIGIAAASPIRKARTAPQTGVATPPSNRRHQVDKAGEQGCPDGIRDMIQPLTFRNGGRALLRTSPASISTGLPASPVNRALKSTSVTAG